jgi:hypothetical protein
MPEINPIAEGAKSLSEGLSQAREAGKSLTKSIEDIQHDGVEVARQELEALEDGTVFVNVFAEGKY